jgi:hypothetical protein
LALRKEVTVETRGRTTDGLVKRGCLLVAAVFVLLYSMVATYESVVGLMEPAHAAPLPGLGGILAVATVVTGLTLARESLRRVLRPGAAARTLAAFGWGWVAGVVINLAITVSRTRSVPGLATPLDVALELLGWTLALAVVAVPGVVALIVSRRIA